MSNPFSEDALIEQPAIRLFKDGRGGRDVAVQRLYGMTMTTSCPTIG